MNSEELIKSLLEQEGNEQLEFREVVNKDAIGKTICAFLNNNGGQLLIGVSADKKVLGVEMANKIQSELENYLNKEILPETPIMVSVEKYEDKQVVLVKVWAGSRQPYIFDGSIYFRRAASTVKANSNEISELIHKRQQTEIHWERQSAMGVELEDLDSDEIQQTIKEAINTNRVNELKSNPLDFLTHFGLFQNGQFTNAAIVLFAKNPARYIPQARVRIAFLEKGKTADEFVDDQLLEGNLFKNIVSIQNFLERHLNTSRKFDDKNWKRTDDYVVPMSALREGVLNALVHRSYFQSFDSVSIIIYSDRIEIANSGKSPLMAAELRKNHLSMPVNPDIAHMVFLRGYIEKIGRGTLKIIEACKEAGLKAPVWNTTENSVKLTFYTRIKVGAASDGAIDG
ncbi:MAG: putative DNA binding domain-containing protein, partial [Bacteroidota bacterium]|nr:putative DNA binding domain-containing protein [Bacteroidota bacterium]